MDDRPDTRDRILKAAEDLFADKGFKETTVRDIAGKATVNVALINYHFGSKEDLYKEILRERFAPLVSAIEAITADPTLKSMERLERLVDTYLDFVFENPTIPRLIVREMSLRSEISLWFVREITSKITGHIFMVALDAQARGLVRKDVDIGVLFPSLIGAIVFNVITEPMIRIIRDGLGLAPISMLERKREVRDVILTIFTKQP